MKNGDDTAFEHRSHRRLTPKYGPVATQVLRSYLGVRWWTPLVVFFLILLWPIFIFRKSIQFNPAAFVQEWIRIGVNAFLIFLIVEIARFRSVAFQTIETYLAFCLRQLGITAAALRRFRESIPQSTSEAASHLSEAWNAWEALSDLFSGDSHEFASQPILRAWFVEQRAKLDPERCTAILRELSTAQGVADVNAEELDELLKHIDLFLETVGGDFSKR